LLAKALERNLTSASRQGRAAFMTVTFAWMVSLVSGKNADFEPVSGGLFGLVKSLNLEWEAVFCRGIDLSPNWMPSSLRVLPLNCTIRTA
jgi:hypothetical protein